MSKVLLVGEQNTETRIVVEGFDVLTYIRAAQSDFGPVEDALREQGHEVTMMETGDVQVHFPESLQNLNVYDVILVSDVGSNSFLLHPKVFSDCERRPNRLHLLKEYIAGGGGFIMVGGWISFTGIEGKAKYHGTHLEKALPVTCLPTDDRIETPEGVVPIVVKPDHPILQGVPAEWPYFLGYNKVFPKEQSETILKFEEDPLLCVWDFGKGRAAAFSSDCVPHWGPPSFLEWEGYSTFWSNLMNWLARKA